MGSKQWKRYENKNFSRHKFQIDLAIDLMNYAKVVSGRDAKERLSFMPKGHLVPCECNKSFFCVKGLTNGIIHGP
jgi:hypothetical protein